MPYIRLATVGDIPALRALAAEIWRHSYAPILSAGQIEYMLGLMYSEARIREEIADGICWEIYHLAETPIAFLATSHDPDGRMKLHKLYLHPRYQSRGYGQTLLAHVAEKARACGAREIWLQVNKRNQRAIAAYHRAGYHIAREAVFDIGGGYRMDDYLMALSLPPQAEKDHPPKPALESS